MKISPLLAITSLLASGVQAQDLRGDLESFARISAVSGDESRLMDAITKRLSPKKAVRDNLGNLLVEIGSGSPRRLVITGVDEPGYVVSGVDARGYLRLQRLTRALPHPLFDELFVTQPVRIHGRSGEAHGVMAGPSVHLRGDALEKALALDGLFVDVGASSGAEVKDELLSPVSIEREPVALFGGREAGFALGDRFGAAALVQAFEGTVPPGAGSLTLAFVTEQWAGGRGTQRVLEESRADEVLFVSRAKGKDPGSGVSVEPLFEQPALAKDLEKRAQDLGIRVSEEAPFKWDFGDPPLCAARLGVFVSWPETPAELLDLKDVAGLASLLRGFVTEGGRAPEIAEKSEGLKKSAGETETLTGVLRALVETAGVSGHEAPVRDAVKRLLPAWAHPETDPAGNLVLTVGRAAQGPKILFVAHLDEIGYAVESVSDDGRLVVEPRGGFRPEYFLGHPALIHTGKGDLPGILELPQGWDTEGFSWPKDRRTRFDVGARSAREASALGIAPGDTVSVPKAFRRLRGTRAGARSFDDRVGCAALVGAVRALGGELPGRNVSFVWSTGEEVGLKGAAELARSWKDKAPDIVFAVDTFVSSDSPVESSRFGLAPLGEGFVIRAIDQSNLSDRSLVDRLIKLAKGAAVPVQYGVTGGGNDGSAFLRYGSRDLPLAWPLRYSHSPGEIIDTRDLDALARIVTILARSW
jgi:putative aminopeptidase FrvX